MNYNLIYNVMLFGLTIEEILTVILSIWDRPFSNIFLQIYPSLVLIGNFGLMLKFLNCKIKISGIDLPQDNIDFIIQILYLLLIFLIFIFDLFLLDNKTFDKDKKILFISEKIKLLYVNGILGGLVNIISIIYLIIILRQAKYKIEKDEFSLNLIN